MSRAAILPFPGDPFLLHYWLIHFEHVWQNEVDKLYIYLNSTIEAEVVDYIRELCARNPKINLQYNDVQIEHGNAIDRTLDIVTEDYVMLVEDDAFVFKIGMVNHCFSMLEHGMQIVGSKRGSCAQTILDRATIKWGIRYEGLGDQGPNFWPCFFFSRKDLLTATDRHFEAKAWHKGQEIPELSIPGDPFIVQEEVIYGDTFVNTSLALRNMVDPEKILYVKQHHGSPNDIEDAKERRLLFDGTAGWCHIGSLSSGIGGVLMDPYRVPLARRMIPGEGPRSFPTINSDMERMEWERRVQWWLTFYEKREVGKIDAFAELYYLAIERLKIGLGLSIKTIRQRQEAYSRIGLL